MSRLIAPLVVVLASCIDFGYQVPPPVPAIDAAGDPVDADGDGASACVEGPTQPSAAGPQIAFITLAVDAPVKTVRVGDVVTWTNTDTMVHTATAGAPGAPQGPPLGFDSGDLAPGASWAYRFCSARTAIYFCKTHASQMNGYRVVVQP